MACASGKVLRDKACFSIISHTNVLRYNVSFFATLTTEVAKLQKLVEHFNDFMNLVEMRFPGKLHAVGFGMHATSITCRNNTAVVELSAHAQLMSPERFSVDDKEARLMSFFRNSRGKFYQPYGKIVFTLLEPAIGVGKNTGECPHLDEKISREKLRSDFEWREIGMPLDRPDSMLVKTFTPLLLCPQVALSGDEYVHSGEKDTLVVRATNALIPHPFFSLQDGVAWVCADTYLSGFHVPPQQGDSVDGLSGEGDATSPPEGPGTELTPAVRTLGGVLSFSCTLVSLVCLALTLLAHAVYKEMRTIAGVCVACMVGVLFLAQAVFEFGGEQTEIAGVCIALGALAHYLWLSATFWMNACTALMFYRLMFPLRAMVALHSRVKILVISSLYCYLSPAMVVGAVIGSSLALHGDMGYGGSICYIKRAWARRYGLAVPVGCLVLVNLALFLVTIVRLRRGSLVSTKQNRVGVFACTKLSVITGLSWLSMFLYEGLRYEAIAYVAMVLFGLQGVVVFLVFAFKHYAASFRSSWEKRQALAHRSSESAQVTISKGRNASEM